MIAVFGCCHLCPKIAAGRDRCKGRATIKTSFLNNAISLLMGLIIGLIVIGLVEESLKFVAFPPLIADVLVRGFAVLGYRIAYYQIVVLGNSALWGLNLGPGLLTIVEADRSQVPAISPVPAPGSESMEVSLVKPVEVPVLKEPGLHMLNEVYTQYEQGRINAEEYKQMRKQLVHEWHLARQAKRFLAPMKRGPFAFGIAPPARGKPRCAPPNKRLRRWRAAQTVAGWP